MTRETRDPKTAENARRKALGIGTRISYHDALEEDRPFLHLEDVRVGDVVQFVGKNATLSQLPGFRLGTVTEIHPLKRTMRIESRITLQGEERCYFKAEVHETRLLKNHGAVKRVVV